MTDVDALATFDFAAFFAAVDDARRDRDMGWCDLASEAPEEFLTGPALDVGDAQLPVPGPESRLRWDLAQLHLALSEERKRQGLTWTELAEQIGCTPSRLTNLRTARMADMALTMRVTQWLRRPAAEFIHPASSRHRAELL